MFLRLLLVLVVALGLAKPALSAAQSSSENAEARVYFEEGNRLYQKASRARDAERTELLQRSLEAYVDSLRIVRSRNALFNAAIVLGELERYDESFNYFGEYLGIEGLSADDRLDATRRQDALRERVAVLRVTTEPRGASVWIDRKDLAARGKTPIEIALPPGEHRVFIEMDGFTAVERSQQLVRGQTIAMEVSLVLAAVEEPPPVQPLAEPEPEPRPRLRNAAIGTAAGALATTGVALGLSLHARSLNDEYERAAARYARSGDPADRQRAEDLADQTDRYNLAADVFWGTTIALGVSAIVLGAVHGAKQKRERPELGVSVSKQGAYASVRMPFGARP